MQTLIQIQDAAIAKLDVTRSSAGRYLKLRGSVHRWYLTRVAILGYAGEQAEQTWRDVRDMYELMRGAE